MSSLYEINEKLSELTDKETGEIADESAFEALQMERDERIENVALWYKNLMSEAAAFKAEKDVFAERQKQAENKEESLKKYLDSVLNGNKFDTVKAPLSNTIDIRRFII